jgi:N-acetylglucosaminyldiphosphoundecaprenol N-acetyl-beta-D-mannosaminyltransferase
MIKNTTLFDILLYNGTYSEFFSQIQHPEKKTLVFTPNPEIFVRASRDDEFMSILKQATYNVPDGNGLYVGYMMQRGMGFFVSWLRTFFDKKGVRKEYGELVKGSDLVRDILESASNAPKKILVIDRKNAVPQNEFEQKKAEVQKNLKDIIQSKYPGVELFVVFSGEKTPEEIAKLVEQESIEYIFSCVGMKAQEKLLVEIFSHLPNTKKVVGLGVGASIDFLLGLQKRAPIVFQRLWLEWLYRLITQPRIRARRIYDAFVEFPKLIKKSSKN